MGTKLLKFVHSYMGRFPRLHGVNTYSRPCAGREKAYLRYSSSTVDRRLVTYTNRSAQFHFKTLLASERSERDTIRGVQIRAGAVHIYIYVYGDTYAIIVAHATHT